MIEEDINTIKKLVKIKGVSEITVALSLIINELKNIREEIRK